MISEQGGAKLYTTMKTFAFAQKFKIHIFGKGISVEVEDFEGHCGDFHND